MRDFSFLWAFAERLVPRIASAGLVLLFAAVTSPGVVGYYSTIVLVLTFLQAIFDAGIRQITPELLTSERGLRFLRRYAWTYGVLGPLILLAVTMAVMAVAPNSDREVVPQLLPVLAVPLAAAIGAKPLAKLQYRHDWSRIAKNQMLAVSISLAVSIPVLFVTKSALGPSLQLLLVESINVIFLFVTSRKISIPLSEKSISINSPLRLFFSASMYSGIGWTQSQADRVFVAVLAGPIVLGLYSFAWSLSRAVNDPIAIATANVLRPKIMQAANIEDRKRIIADGIARALLALSGTLLLIWIACRLILPRFMSAEWAPALHAAPVMAMATLPVVFSWSLTPALTAERRLARALPWKFLGIPIGILVGYIAMHDLYTAAWLAVGREILLLVPMAILAHRYLRSRSVILLFCILTLFSTFLIIEGFII